MLSPRSSPQRGGTPKPRVGLHGPKAVEPYPGEEITPNPNPNGVSQCPRPNPNRRPAQKNPRSNQSSALARWRPPPLETTRFGHSHFDFRACFGFRYSNFGFRILTPEFPRNQSAPHRHTNSALPWGGHHPQPKPQRGLFHNVRGQTQTAGPHEKIRVPINHPPSRDGGRPPS